MATTLAAGISQEKRGTAMQAEAGIDLSMSVATTTTIKTETMADTAIVVSRTMVVTASAGPTAITMDTKTHNRILTHAHRNRPHTIAETMVLGAIDGITTREQITATGMDGTMAMINFREETPLNMATAIGIGTIATRLTIIVEGIIEAMRRIISMIEWIDRPMPHVFGMGETAGHRMDPRPQSESQHPLLHPVLLKAETARDAEERNTGIMITRVVIAAGLAATTHDTAANRTEASAMAAEAVVREETRAAKKARAEIRRSVDGMIRKVGRIRAGRTYCLTKMKMSFSTKKMRVIIAHKNMAYTLVCTHVYIFLQSVFLK